VVGEATLFKNVGSLCEWVHLVSACFDGLCSKGKGKVEISLIKCHALFRCLKACLREKKKEEKTKSKKCGIKKKRRKR